MLVTLSDEGGNRVELSGRVVAIRGVLSLRSVRVFLQRCRRTARAGDARTVSARLRRSVSIAQSESEGVSLVAKAICFFALVRAAVNQLTRRKEPTHHSFKTSHSKRLCGPEFGRHLSFAEDFMLDIHSRRWNK